MGGETKRQLARLDLSIKVRVSCESADAFSTHFSQNLSTDGVFVRARNPRPVGTMLELEYVLADGTTALRGSGIVRWVRGEKAGEVTPTGMGIQLVDVDDAGRRFLTELLRKNGASTPPWVTAVAAAAAYQSNDAALSQPFVAAAASGATIGDIVGAPAMAPDGKSALHASTERGSDTVAPGSNTAESGADGMQRPGLTDVPAEATATDGSPGTLVLTDSRVIERKLELIIDLSGPELVAGLAISSAGRITVGVPSSLTPRLIADAEGLRVQAGGVWVPCLVPLARLRWPSPTAALWARRFGLRLGGDGYGGVAIMLAGRMVPVGEALIACLRELLDPYANSDMLPAETQLVLPTDASPNVTRAVRSVLSHFGHSSLTVITDAVALAAASSAKSLRPRGSLLVIQTSLLETNVALVDAGGAVVQTRSALDTGLWRADDIMAEQLALRLILANGASPRDDAAFRRELVAAVAAARAETPARGKWRMSAGDLSCELEEHELRDLAAAASMRVLLACEDVLSAGAPRGDDLVGVLLAADEPPWPGLADALGQGLGYVPELVGVNPWCRIEGAVALAGRSQLVPGNALAPTPEPGPGPGPAGRTAALGS